MAKKIIPIYTEIDSYSAERFASAINDAERFRDDVHVRISTNGGSVEQGWTLLALLDSFTGNKSISVDGRAYSMGAMMCLYSDSVEAYDVSKFMIHRASYGWIENSEYFTDEMKSQLDSINNSLKAKMKSKLNADAFKSALGVSIDDVFKGERKDYFFDAKTAKKIGLISSIKTLDSVAKSEINAICTTNGVAAMYNDSTEESTQKTEPINSNKMTIETLKKDHPEIVAALKNEVLANVKAWAGYMDIDAEAAKKGMATGEAPTQAQIAEMNATFIRTQASKNDDATVKETETEIPEVGASASAGQSPEKEKVDPRFAEIDAMFNAKNKK